MRAMAAAVLAAAILAGGGGLAATGEASGAEPRAAAVPAGAVEILNADSFWRYHLTLRKPMVGGRLMKCPVSAGWGLGSDAVESAPLADKDWQKPEYDDSSWARSTARFALEHKTARWSRFRYCLRGRFRVDNPGAVRGLYFTMKFRGGAVVYLNGREVARARMPAGELKPDAPASPYPESVYVGKDGELVVGDKERNPKIRPSAEVQALREPTLGPIALPRGLLRKGVNVIAIDLRRAPFSKHSLKWKKHTWSKVRPWFMHIGLAELKLQAVGGGVRANVRREPGVQVWAVDRNDRVSSMDYPDALGGAGAAPVRIVAARNGSFCGQVAVASGGPLSGVSARVSDLKGAGGSIPSSAVAVLYGQTDQQNRRKLVWSDGLCAGPAAKPQAGKGGFAIPAVLRVAVPGDAKAGLYKGKVSVTAGGRSVDLPVELRVSEWVLPDARDWKIHTSIYTSPESIAAKYGVGMWSEKHWKLMEKSWRLLGRAGNELVVVPAAKETQFGNPESMIRYRKKGGKWEYDFSIFDRYVDMAKKHCGKLNHVALQIWFGGGYGPRKIKADNKCTVTLVDGQGKITGEWRAPRYDSPESVAFWKPLLAAVDTRLKKRGMPDALCVGILSDSTAPEEVLARFDEAFPGGKCRWMRGCHVATVKPEPYSLPRKGRGLVVLHEFCYGSPKLDPAKKLPPLWDYVRRPGAYYNRVPMVNGEHHMTLAAYRTFGEVSLYRSTRGIGRICLDYWLVAKEKRAHYRNDTTPDLFNRYPHSCCYQRRPTLTRMSWPGPAGAEPTARFEAMIESLQDAETVMYLSDAIDNHAARIGRELESRCRRLIARRVEMAFNSEALIGSSHGGSHIHAYPFKWQELAKELYDLAAEVKKKLG